MENSYGIGVTNRYELFYVDDDVGDPSDKILIKKAKQQKKSAAAAATVAANGGGAEKENKSATLNKATTVTTTTTTASTKLGKGGVSNQNGQQQNNRNNSDRQPREGKDNNNKNSDRKNDVNRQNQQNGETREQRYNRKNRENRENQPFNSNNNNQDYNNANPNRSGDSRPPRRQGGGGNFGNDRGPPNRRQFGKREFDRQSGSDKTGVKAIDKREGGGAHNWGSHKHDIEDLNKTTASDWDPERDAHKDDTNKTNDGTSNLNDSNEQSPGKDNSNDQTNNQTAEEEAKEITLDEWKAQRAVRSKPQYNIRKAGEGEDTSQWKKMIALQSRKKKDDENSDDELEYDPSLYPQRVGRQKHVLDIDIHFNDGPRGGLNRRRGRPRTQRTWNGNNNVTNGTNAATNPGDGENAGGNNTERRRNPQSNRNRGPRGGDGSRREYFDDRQRGGQNAPKVDDEHDFPSLG